MVVARPIVEEEATDTGAFTPVIPRCDAILLQIAPDLTKCRRETLLSAPNRPHIHFTSIVSRRLVALPGRFLPRLGPFALAAAYFLSI